MRSKDLLPPRFLMNQDMLIGIRIKAEMEMPSLTQVPDDGTKILNSIILYPNSRREMKEWLFFLYDT